MQNSNDADGVSRRRNVYRRVAFVLALTVIGLWIKFAAGIFFRSGTLPAPGGIMMPIFYCVVAATAARAAVRDEPLVLIIAGAFSFFPGGLFLVFIPGTTRFIALCDLTLVVLGVLLLRSHSGKDVDAEEATS
jgi:hypothetical protein